MSIQFVLPHAATFLPKVMEFVLAAGALIRAEFHRPGGPRGQHGKAPVDTQVEAFLRERLIALHPCDWHGEELPRQTGGHPDAWVVDPQDGTTAFLRGLRGSAISVALVRNGTPVLGVVFAPCAPDDAGDLFYWAEGMAPMRNGQPLAAIGPRPAPYEPFDSIPWPSVPAEPRAYDHATILALNERAGDYAAHNHALFAPAGVLAVPSIAYRLALAAAGEVDAAISLTVGLDSYDLAGGHALLAAVGGSLCELDGMPITHGGCRRFHGCIGGRPEIVDVVRARRPGTGHAVPRHPAKPARRTSASGPLRWSQGALLGLLVGDALGSQVEFQSPGAILRQHPKGLRDLLPGGTWNLLAGQPTDDGEMALALARALLEGGGFDRERVARAYIDWKGSNPFDIGTTTMKGIDALRDRGRTNAASQANGALMRVAPIGIAAGGDPAKAADWARQDAALTHPHPICRATSAAFAAAIAAGVAGADPAAMWSEAHAHAGDDVAAEEIRQCLIEAREAPPPDFTRNQGWVLTAFGNAFHRLWIDQDFAEALTGTVMGGGDTDTNAAICGALLGAAQGRDSIPVRWRNQVLACRAVPVRGVVHPRPHWLWADDALELAEALLPQADYPAH
ncbi:inositol monophosphatase family protein [Cereibacter sphaeroides]|uniref:inositol monophosphatase family protein n=1 Tax=Cereibacter sphaeroides TaxID=1063 RepID=UPI001F19E1D2|nr:inositol monophosphatase family protein [Cereibacter sphaeroides]MCE6968056.1 ADP-ribosylglycohydrolase family protein [Cereibacter sphaeroides]